LINIKLARYEEAIAPMRLALKLNPLILQEGLTANPDESKGAKE
jgi:hypothetical protein